MLRRLKTRNHAVVVVAEGADTAVIDLAKSGAQERDPSGNLLHSDIGQYLKKGIVEYGKKQGIDITLKYIDPTYTIRSVPACASDTILCTKLAHSAVHGAMAGYTMFSTGSVRSVTCFIPIE